MKINWFYGGAITLVLGCSGAQTTSTVLVTDSSGVRVVENPDRNDLAVWTFDQTPQLVIEHVNGIPFGDIVAVTRLVDGQIAVADAFARQVSFFDEDGTYQSTFGGRGSGPGEFETIATIFHDDARRVGIYDSRLARLTTVSLRGEMLGSARIAPVSPKDNPMPVGWLDGGQLVVVHNPRDSIGRAHYRQRLNVMWHDSNGILVDSITTVPGPEMWDWEWEMGVTPGAVPFGKNTVARIRHNSMYLATNQNFQVDRYDSDGHLVGIMRIHREPIPLPASAVASYKAGEREKAMSGIGSKGPSEIFVRMADAAPYPEYLAPYEDMLVDRSGRVWIRESRTDDRAPVRFTVFDANGVVVGRIDFPHQFQPTDVDDDFVVGIWQDELDVESVRMYRLDPVNP